MKTERRHELQTNDLANWVGGQVQELKPYMQSIIGVAVLLAVGLFLVSFMSARRAQQRETSWQDYYAAAIQRDVTKLLDLADKYPGTSASAWALQSAGDISLADGTNMQHRDREGAMKQYELAKASYENAVAAADSELLRQRSLLGLGQACEALNDFAGAKQQYENVVSQWPDTSVARLAKKKIVFLGRPNNREFYQWFLAQKPYTPAVPPGGVPASGSSSAIPGTGATNPFGVVAPEGSAFPGGLGDTTPDVPAEVNTDDALELGDPAPTTDDALPVTEESGESAP